MQHHGGHTATQSKLLLFKQHQAKTLLGYLTWLFSFHRLWLCGLG